MKLIQHKFLSKKEKISRLKNRFRNNESHNNWYSIFYFICGIHYILVIFFTKETFYDMRLKFIPNFKILYVYLLYYDSRYGNDIFLLKGNLSRIIISANYSFSHNPFFFFIIDFFIYIIIINIAYQNLSIDSFY